jgi:hypothetical protein
MFLLPVLHFAQQVVLPALTNAHTLAAYPRELAKGAELTRSVAVDMLTSGGLDLRFHTDLSSEDLPSSSKPPTSVWTNYTFSSRAVLEMKPSGSVRRVCISTDFGPGPLPTVPDLLSMSNARGDVSPAPHLIPTGLRWYLVTRGRRVGIFRGLHIAQPLVDGVSGAAWQRVTSQKAGTAQFMEALVSGVVYEVSDDGIAFQVEPCSCEVDVDVDADADSSSKKGSRELEGLPQDCEPSVNIDADVSGGSGGRQGSGEIEG